MTAEIDLLPLPEWMSRYIIPADGFEGDKDVVLADRMHDYARANVARNTALLRAEIKALREGEEVWRRVAAAEAELRGKAEERAERLRAEVDALARENEAMRRCAIRYLRWLGVTHKPLDAALREDMANPDMCGDAAIAAACHPGQGEQQ